MKGLVLVGYLVGVLEVVKSDIYFFYIFVLKINKKIQ